MTQLPRAFAPILAVALLTGALNACSKAPEPAAATPAVAGAAANVPDQDVTEHVKVALQGAVVLKGTDITVVTTKGDVRVTGALETQAQIDEVLRIAQAADGAHTVHNELTLKK